MNKENFLRLLQSLLPNGPAWPRNEDSWLTKLLSGISGILFYAFGRARKLKKESVPITVDEMLPDWEETLNIKVKKGKTFGERREAVITKLTQKTSLTVNAYKQLAKTFGYEVEVREYRPFICGLGRCGSDYLDGPAENRFYLSIKVKGNRLRYGRCAVLRCGEPIQKILYAQELEEALKEIRLAHVIIKTSYEGENS